MCRGSFSLAHVSRARWLLNALPKEEEAKGELGDHDGGSHIGCGGKQTVPLMCSEAKRRKVVASTSSEKTSKSARLQIQGVGVWAGGDALRSSLSEVLGGEGTRMVRA